MAKPALVVVDDDAATEDDLPTRYGADYHVVAYGSVEQGHRPFSQLGASVAVVLVQLWLPEINGVDLLAGMR